MPFGSPVCFAWGYIIATLVLPVAPSFCMWLYYSHPSHKQKKESEQTHRLLTLFFIDP